ncbi:MAG: bifunctional phosphoribosylaminoimidazolecarboxamide formyltransferase/IMP cyclohydrolase [Chitinophagales bacterium]|nr:bifunctional phosphoribosylaminoimidazolecarboxamide formyltransferase/IMP cyclohydrolase [Chitinophagales bacterium]
MEKRINTALISVYYKDGLDNIAKALNRLGVKIYSTGGTQRYIEELGIPVTAVEELTSYPSILGGRVKTLHPKVFGGILGRRNSAEDCREMKQYDIPAIDLVVVDLYPFEDTVAGGASHEDVIEKIDIGGVSLIRAAAKNFADTLVIATRDDYEGLLRILTENNGKTDRTTRMRYAAKAFSITSHYDTRIFQYFNEEVRLPVFTYSEHNAMILRYGENPHQQGTFFGNLNEIFDVLGGKELSYNNLVDIDSAVQLVGEFTEPTVAIIKHTNSCGLASRGEIAEAYQAALACDPTSAFGGIIAVNRPVDTATADLMNSLFFEALIAPAFDPKALETLRSKKNRILLRWKKQVTVPVSFKSVLNGVLVQSADLNTEKRDTFKVVTNKRPTEAELSDLEFAIVAVKHLKSNGIALAKNKQLIGSNSGQTSRVDALQYAITRAKTHGFDLRGAVMASDAFFPFPDCVNISAAAGITAIAQPGGSIRDQESIDAANAAGIAMVFTGVRHFRH